MALACRRPVPSACLCRRRSRRLLSPFQSSPLTRNSAILRAAGDVPAAIEEKTMSELRDRMSDAMALREMAARTQETHIGVVADLAMFYH